MQYLLKFQLDFFDECNEVIFQCMWSDVRDDRLGGPSLCPPYKNNVTTIHQ